MVTDLFFLKCSEEFDIQNNQAVRLDLGLSTTPPPPGQEITGKVTHCGRPIPNATVVVLDAQFNPVTNTQTDQDGMYFIAGLNPQRYGLTATSTGFPAADTIFISLMENEIKIANIELKRQNRSQ
jgi:hypothetical protein